MQPWLRWSWWGFARTFPPGQNTTTLPVGRALKLSLKKYSPAVVNVYENDSPGCRRTSNSPSKNWVTPRTLTLSTGLTNVTVVPTGTRRWVGAIALTAVDSVVPTVLVAALYVRASTMVLFTTAPSTGPPDTGRRTTGGVGVAAGATRPSILNAH